jgi:hypothetical protein
MFISTSGTETCLNQVSRKSNNNQTEKTKKTKVFYMNEIFPEEFENKIYIKVDYKKLNKNLKKLKNSDYYRFCKRMWSRNKVFL